MKKLSLLICLIACLAYAANAQGFWQKVGNVVNSAREVVNTYNDAKSTYNEARETVSPYKTYTTVTAYYFSNGVKQNTKQITIYTKSGDYYVKQSYGGYSSVSMNGYYDPYESSSNRNAYEYYVLIGGDRYYFNF